MTNYLDQVRRVGDAYISRHDRLFVVRQRFYIGAPICRWDEDHTVIEARALHAVIKALPCIDGPIAIIAIDVVQGTAIDVSKESAIMVAERVRDGEFDLTDDLRNFIEEYFSPGSVIPAAA